MYYQLLGFVGLALGSVGSGCLIAHLQTHRSVVAAYRTIFAIYASDGFIKILLSVCLTEATELEKQDQGASAVSRNDAAERRPLLPTIPTIRPSRFSPHIDILVSPTGRPSKSPPRIRLGLVIALFGIDAFASSLTPASYVALFLQRIHGVSIETITTVLAGAALSAVVFSLSTGALVKRLGLVPAMVTTHSECVRLTAFGGWINSKMRSVLTRIRLVPAQLITCGLAFAPTLPGAISLYIARTSLSSMDASIRVSSAIPAMLRDVRRLTSKPFQGTLLSAMVPPEARTRLLGGMHLTRTRHHVCKLTLDSSRSRRCGAHPRGNTWTVRDRPLGRNSRARMVVPHQWRDQDIV